MRAASWKIIVASIQAIDRNTAATSNPSFSICVATRNRAALLRPMVENVSRLSGATIELIIVDDGSTDETCDELQRLEATTAIPLRWASIPHGGRGAALNRAFDLARGDLIFILDDDDIIAPDALSDVLATWNSIPEDERQAFCGVCGLAAHPDGTIVGDRFPHDREDSDFFTLRVVNRVRGDKREVFRRTALGTWRFPSHPGEFRVSTNLLWFELASRYKTRFVNRVWLTKTYRPDGISAAGRGNKLNSPTLTALYNETVLRLFPAMPWWVKLRFGLDYARYAAHAGIQRSERQAVVGATLQGALLLRLGELASSKDRRRMGRAT
jgi:glycosyltransferase involved in cell wall biosynthesis